MQINIDPEFQDLIPPLAKDELEQLEANILAEGCRDPLVLWANHDILLDGHNRYAVCEKHGLGFRTVRLELPNREAAHNWLIENQLGRRNLTPEAVSYLRGKQYNGVKSDSAGNLKQNTPRGQNVPSVNTAERLAEQHKVSEKTIKRDGAYAPAVDKLAEVGGATLKQNLLSRSPKPPTPRRVPAQRVLSASHRCRDCL